MNWKNTYRLNQYQSCLLSLDPCISCKGEKKISIFYLKHWGAWPEITWLKKVYHFIALFDSSPCFYCQLWQLIAGLRLTQIIVVVFQYWLDKNCLLASANNQLTVFQLAVQDLWYMKLDVKLTLFRTSAESMHHWNPTNKSLLTGCTFYLCI